MDASNATSVGGEKSLVAASFITEVLASAGRLEKDDLNAKLGKLFKRIDEVKAEVYEAIESEYKHFLPYLTVAPELSSRVDTFYNDVSDVTEKLQTEMKTQLNTSTTEFQELSKKLEEATHMSALLKYLMELHTLESSAMFELEEGSYSAAGQHLKAMQHKLEEISNHPTYGKCEIQVLTALSLTHRKHLDTLESRLFESWGSHIKWTLPSQQKNAEGQQVTTTSLSIQSSEEATKTLTHTIQGLHQLDLLEPKVKVLAKRFMDYILRLVVVEKRTVAVRGTKIQGSTMQELSLKKIKKKKGGEPKLEEVFDQIKLSLKFLNDHLCSIKVSGDEESKHLMSLLEPIISIDLLKLIIEHCLAPAIPTSKKDLEVFQVVVNATQSLQNSLIKMQLISSSENSLVEYVNSIDMLFANKKCQGILSQARDLMRSEIHDTVKVSPEGPYQDIIELLPEHLKKAIQSSKEEKTATNLSMASDVKLNAETFRLPNCRISLSTQKLVKLAYEVMVEATQSNEAAALQLFGTVRQMFELYIAVVPTYHKDSLSALPQLAALHHNNCMYVAHNLLLLKHQFHRRLPEVLRMSSADLIDMVPGVRRAGTDCFLRTMTTQRDQLIELLSAVNGFVGVSEENNKQIADQAVRQVFHQLELLSKVWRGVLPWNIYTKSLGTLLQSVIKQIIDSIIALDDISADDATELALILGVFEERAPGIFTPRSPDDHDPSDRLMDAEGMDMDEQEEQQSFLTKSDRQAGLAVLMKNVSRWGQLLELRIVLDAGLQEMSDRWADAKGPLAVQFSANEVKKMIRALFQNTDRRAAVLATIRQPVKN